MCLVIPLTAILAGSGCADADDRTGQTGAALLCLAADRHAEVVRAATLLELADTASDPEHLVDGGRYLSVPEWQASQPREFEDACAAVVAAVRLEQGGPTGGADDSFWAWLRPLLVGAVLALVSGFVSTGWRERIAEARRQGAALRSAKSAYVSAVVGFLATTTDARKPLPSGGSLNEPRLRLQRGLDEVPGRDRTPGVRQARELLHDGVLDDRLGEGWSRPEDRVPDGPRAVAVSAALDQLTSAVETTIAARERPIRSFLRRGWPFTRRERVTPA